MSNHEQSDLEAGAWRGRMETMLEHNTDSTRRLEIRLLGEDGHPETGLIANVIARVTKLELDRVRLGVVLVMAMGIFHLLGEHIMENVWQKFFPPAASSKQVVGQSESEILKASPVGPAPVPHKTGKH